MANQFGSDGTAFALHLAVGVPGRTELRARAIALTMLMGPVLAVALGVVAVVLGRADELPNAIGTILAGLGVSAGAAALVSVLAPYAFPESTNPFAVTGNAGGLRALLAFLGALSALVLIAPIIVLALVVHGPVAGWLVPLAGLGWGAAGMLLGTYIAGDILDRRGPEILVAVTPGR